MEDLFYNILWIDDEHESLSSTKGRAKSNGINLIGFKSLNSGMSELERNLHFYDGILLDAKFYENDDDVAGSEDTENVHRAKERLLQLNKKFEIFVYTGQAEAFDDKTFHKSFKRVYKKGSSVERDKLFDDIKLAAATQEDTQIRHKYKRVFEVCTEKYIGKFAGQDILNLFKVTDETNIDNHFNAIRKVVEDLLIAFNKFNLLPDEFVTSGVALNESCKFLTGKGGDGSLFSEKGYQHLEETHLPKQIAFYLRSILYVTQAGSHRSEVDSYVKFIKTPFLLKSVFFQLLDMLAWFKMYVDSNPKTENWVKVGSSEEVAHDEHELIDGIAFNINPLKGYAFFKADSMVENVFIPPHLVATYSITDGKRIQVEIEEYTDSRTNELKKRVKRLNLIS